MTDTARRIAALDRQIRRHELAASDLRAERRDLRAGLRADGASWAAIGAISGDSPAAIQKDLRDDDQRAAENEKRRSERRRPVATSA